MTNLFTGDVSSQLSIRPLPPNTTKSFFNDITLPLEADAVKAAIAAGKTSYGLFDVTYTSNSNGFRCDEFETSNSPVVVFSGCSFTFGHFLPLEDVWAHRVITRLRAEIDPNIKYFNLGMPGASIDHMTRALLAFSKTIKPDVIVGLLPDRSRTEIFCENQSVVTLLMNSSVHLQYLLNSKEMSVESKQLIKSYQKSVQGDKFFDAYRLGKNLAIIDLLRQATGSSVILSSWLEYDELFDCLPDDFSHLFAPFIFSGLPGWSEEIIKKTSKNAQDGVHPGPAAHEAFAHLMYPLVKQAVEKCLTAE